METFKYTIDSINQQDDILPNMTVGYAIIESCNHPYKYLYAAATMYFVPDTDMKESTWNITGSSQPCNFDASTSMFLKIL